jgi:hypothetical protein
VRVLKEGRVVQGYKQSTPSEGKEHVTLESHDNLLSIIKWGDLWRRVDVITLPPEQWFFGLLGWEGAFPWD